MLRLNDSDGMMMHKEQMSVRKQEKVAEQVEKEREMLQNEVDRDGDGCVPGTFHTCKFP